jgi:polyhydroxyalkanoate depolymerase
MSGHYATLLRGTVEALLPEHNVYITDWLDARTVPLSRGSFDLEDSITYVMELLVLLCQKVGCRSRAGPHIDWHDEAFVCFSRCRK